MIEPGQIWHCPISGVYCRIEKVTEKRVKYLCTVSGAKHWMLSSTIERFLSVNDLCLDQVYARQRFSNLKENEGGKHAR